MYTNNILHPLRKNFLLVLLAFVFMYSCSTDDNDAMMPTALCMDGILNQDETAIDCGGVCDACTLVGPPSSGYFFYAIIDGEETILTGTNGFGSGLSTCDANAELLTNGGSWSNADFTGGYSIFLKQNIPFGFSDDPNTHLFLYEPETSSYDEIAMCSDLNTRRAEISFGDIDGVYWTSNDGNQAGSTFEVTSRSPSTGGYAPTSNIEGTFSCKLYNGSEVMELTNGQFRMLLGLF